MSGGRGQPERVLALGMEMGDGTLIRRWCAEGKLPRLKRLLDEGAAWATLETTAALLHVSAWPSLYTGAGPAKHGVYYTFQPSPGIQGYKRFAAGIYGEACVWRTLDKHDRRCVVFDAPYSELEAEFKGVQIVDWGAWAQYLGPRSAPKKALDDLRRECGDYPLGLEAHDLGLVGWRSEDMRERLVRSIAAKRDAIKWLMKGERWDFFFAVFGETHPAAHYCWPQDSRDAIDAPELLSVYQALDAAVGDIVDLAGEGTTVFVVSGDGVGPNYSGWHLLPSVLEKLGYLAKPAPAADAREQRGKDAPKRKFDPVKALRDLIPKDFRKALARRLPTKLRDSLAQRVDTADIDWSRTRAFCLPTDLEGYIRINLRGREPHGIVEPGAEYRAACEQLVAALSALKNPSTGRNAVHDVVIVDDVLAGPRRAQLPDLIVRWRDDAEISALESAAIGTVGGSSPDGRTGTHRPPGFVLVRAARGRRIDIPDKPHVFDFAPTVLAHFGVSKPAAMDGNPWPMT
jgi:predicted AlkP superfamily phosphohydrolase/phosphomutase